MKSLVLVALLMVGCSSTNNKIYKPYSVPEGGFVMAANTDFQSYLSKKLTLSDLELLERKLEAAMSIPLTERGFVQAANRKEEEVDETNYDAVWVRDSVWVYFSFAENGEEEKAKRLISALWDYYASPAQIKRFERVISTPKLAYEGGMHVPHIRFNGKDENFEDVYKDGKPEEWNHRQNDAHGLFLLGVVSAFEKGLLTKKDFTGPRKEVLDLFVPYFSAIKYWDFPDAGAWEEINKINTSSVAMVVKALENWQGHLEHVGWSSDQVNELVEKGYSRLRKNLAMGGESPDHDPYSPKFRREDAALFNLFLPMPLKGLSEQEKLLGLTILEKLIRPYGVIRYPLDSYQSGNYWIKEEKEGVPELTGDSSGEDAFGARSAQFIPDTEAQWFFDSKLSMIYLQFAQGNEHYARLASLHFKRALGQVTPKKGEVIGADGKPVMNFAFPESVNTLVKEGKRLYKPSPITPLNWAKASFSMSLNRLKEHMKKE